MLNKKIWVALLVAVLITLPLVCVYRISHLFYKAAHEPPTAAELAHAAYLQQHEKQIRQTFMVDSMAYTVQDFNYFPRRDTTVLILDMLIENKTNRSRVFTDSAFVLQDEARKVFYPNRTPFTVFENRVQPLKMIYYLPERKMSYWLYELHLNSATDSLQNGFVSFRKSYRDGG